MTGTRPKILRPLRLLSLAAVAAGALLLMRGLEIDAPVPAVSDIPLQEKPVATASQEPVPAPSLRPQIPKTQKEARLPEPLLPRASRPEGVSPRLEPKPPLALRLAESGFDQGDPVFIRIFKQSAELEMWMKDASGWRLFDTWPVCRWSGTLGPKLKEGDGQSPEGFYTVTKDALNPNSSYHLSFNLGFPNAYDRAHGRTGSYLMVHGDCLSIGCYAMTDAGIEDIYGLVEAALDKGQNGVPVHIFPFRLSEEAMAAAQGHYWQDYWANLKQGYDLFEETRIPPVAGVCGTDYVFAMQGKPDCKADG